MEPFLPAARQPPPWSPPVQSTSATLRQQPRCANTPARKTPASDDALSTHRSPARPTPVAPAQVESDPTAAPRDTAVHANRPGSPLSNPLAIQTATHHPEPAPAKHRPQSREPPVVPKSIGAN